MAHVWEKLGAIAVLTAVAIVIPTGANATPLRDATTVVSTTQDGTAVGGSALGVSGDGRLVAFRSRSSALSTVPTNGVYQLYVKDTASGTVTLASVADGDSTIAADADIEYASISADGRFVVFATAAHNLETVVKDTNPSLQVFVHELRPGGFTRALSVIPDGTDGGRGSSFRPVISADGHRVAFQSGAANLVRGSTPVETQVYSVDVPAAGASVMVKLASLRDASRYPGPELANAASHSPVISGDGQEIIFWSQATNLTSDRIPSGAGQLFQHNVDSGRTRLVSVQAGSGAGLTMASSDASMTHDGNTVLFSTSDPGYGTAPAGPVHAYVRDMTTGTVALVSRNRSASGGGDADSYGTTISQDGRFVAFSSRATNITASDNRASFQIYVRDLKTGMSSLVSSTAGDATVGGPSTSNVSMSADGGTVVFDSEGSSFTSASIPPGSKQVYLRHTSNLGVDRIGGADRFIVSAATSADRFPPGTPVAYVASGVNFPDALSASAAAGAQGGPVLLVTKDQIPAPVAAELTRLRPSKIVIVGGTAAVSTEVQNRLGAMTGTVSRIGGANRYAVSATTSANTFEPGTTVVFIASGEAFPDALSGSPAAGRLHAPVLLVAKDQVPAPISDELKRLHPDRLVVLGGVNAISNDTFDALRTIISNASRISGADRFAVSAAVVEQFFPDSAETVFVASGEAFPDALSGSATAIANGSPVVLVRRGEVPALAAAQLERLNPTRIVVLGGPAAVNEEVANALAAYLTP